MFSLQPQINNSSVCVGAKMDGYRKTYRTEQLLSSMADADDDDDDKNGII